MKYRYYLMSLALTAFASVSLTACDDDDPVDEPVNVIDYGNGPGDITFGQETLRVKIGAENRQEIVVAEGAGEYNAYSLNPDIAEVVKGEDGKIYVEGFKNGTTQVVVSDKGGKYQPLTISVYTTDVMTLTQSQLDFNIPLGTTASNNEVSVAEGNGGYSVECNNPKVSVSINSETGAIALRATSAKDTYSANVVVSDASGISATLVVNVIPSFDPFTQDELDEILAKTEEGVWGDCKDPSNGNEPYYYDWRSWGYGSFLNEVNEGTRKIGWWCERGGSDYGGIRIEYPDGTAAGSEVDGKFYFQYSTSQWYDCYEYTGKVKVLEDNATRIVAIFSQVDLSIERINRGWVIVYK